MPIFFEGGALDFLYDFKTFMLAGLVSCLLLFFLFLKLGDPLELSEFVRHLKTLLDFLVWRQALVSDLLGRWQGF